MSQIDVLDKSNALTVLDSVMNGNFDKPGFPSYMAAHEAHTAVAELVATMQKAREALASAIRSNWEGATDEVVAENLLIKRIDAALAPFKGEG